MNLEERLGWESGLDGRGAKYVASLTSWRANVAPLLWCSGAGRGKIVFCLYSRLKSWRTTPQAAENLKTPYPRRLWTHYRMPWGNHRASMYQPLIAFKKCSRRRSGGLCICVHIYIYIYIYKIGVLQYITGDFHTKGFHTWMIPAHGSLQQARATQKIKC